MNNPVRAVATVKSDGRHEATARGRPIARVHIHVLAVETFGAMVSVAISHHFFPTLPASEIFCSLNKTLTHFVVRDGRIGLPSIAWEAIVLPLNQSRKLFKPTNDFLPP